MAGTAMEPTAWQTFMVFIQGMGALALIILGWLWSRINRSQDEVLRAHVRITELEKAILNQRADINRDYPTRAEVRAVLEDVVRPVKEAAERTEKMVDSLVKSHMRNV